MSVASVWSKKQNRKCPSTYGGARKSSHRLQFYWSLAWPSSIVIVIKVRDAFCHSRCLPATIHSSWVSPLGYCLHCCWMQFCCCEIFCVWTRKKHDDEQRRRRTTRRKMKFKGVLLNVTRSMMMWRDKRTNFVINSKARKLFKRKILFLSLRLSVSDSSFEWVGKNLRKCGNKTFLFIISTFIPFYLLTTSSRPKNHLTDMLTGLSWLVQGWTRGIGIC